MDFNLFIGAIQIAIGAMQIKLDHFTNNERRVLENEEREFYQLGETIRILEYALNETVAFTGQTNEREPNPRLAALWENASVSVRNIDNGAELADLVFEKNLYWRNPDFYRKQGANKLYHISLENVLIQLRNLRLAYDKLNKRVRR